MDSAFNISNNANGDSEFFDTSLPTIKYECEYFEDWHYRLEKCYI